MCVVLVSCEWAEAELTHKGGQDLMSMLGRRRKLCSMCAGAECVCKTRAFGRGKGACKGHEEAKHPWALSSLILPECFLCPPHAVLLLVFCSLKPV